MRKSKLGLSVAGLLGCAGALVVAGAAAAAPRTEPAPACSTVAELPTASHVAKVSFASFLGVGSAADTMNVAEAASDCSVYVGGRITNPALGSVAVRKVTAATPAAGTGILVRLGRRGAAVLAAARFGTVINDAQLHPNGLDIVVASDAGVAVLSRTLDATRWSAAGNFTRVAVGPDGTVAALGGATGKQLTVFSATGTVRSTRSFSDKLVNDVAVFGTGATTRVAVTGAAQRDSGGCRQLQVAWIRTYTLANAAAWRAYDWTHAQAFGANRSCADTRGYRLALGQDGKLYFAGESAGGNAIYRYSSLNLTRSAPNVASDPYNNAYNTASNHITYVARIEPATGEVLAGSFLLARLSSGRGNTIRPRALAADAAGNVVLGGISAASIEKRAALTINGAPTAGYSGGDAWVLSLASNFRTRRLWTSLTNGGNAEVQAVAVGNGLIAVAARSDRKNTTTGRAMFTTPNGVGNYTGAKAAYFAVLPTQP